MINKTVLLTKTDGTKVCRFSSDKGCYLQRISTGEKFTNVVCDEAEVLNYVETDEKIDYLAVFREQLEKIKEKVKSTKN